MQNNDQSVEKLEQSEQSGQPEQSEQPNEFEAVKARLEEIANEVDDESLSLDEALDLYEEAVKLGLQASNLLEVGIVVEEEQVTEEAQRPSAEEASADGTSADANAGAGADASQEGISN